MNELRKAAEMALEYMNEYYHGYATQAAHHHRVSTALRQALARPAYPEGDVVGPCICGSWPGGKCLKCPRIEQPTRQELAEASVEPVAWQVMVEDEAMKEFSIKDIAHDWCVQQKLSGSSCTYWIRPLYAAPPKREWVGLTEQERNDLEDYCEMIVGKAAFDAIEAKLKEKNNEFLCMKQTAESYKELMGAAVEQERQPENY